MQFNETAIQAMRSAQVLETTLVVIKPDATERFPDGAVFGYITELCKQNGFSMETRSTIATREMLQKHYYGRGISEILRVGIKVRKAIETEGGTAEKSLLRHEDEPLARLILDAQIEGHVGKQITIIKVMGRNAIRMLSELKGSTDPSKAKSGTIRHKFNTGDRLIDAIREQRALRNTVHIPEDREEFEQDYTTFWAPFETQNAKTGLLRDDT